MYQSNLSKFGKCNLKIDEMRLPTNNPCTNVLENWFGKGASSSGIIPLNKRINVGAAKPPNIPFLLTLLILDYWKLNSMYLFSIF